MPAENAEAVALSMGWKPLEQFSGDPKKWVDADTFVSRGEHFLPIVRADRDRLRSQVEGVTTQLEETRRLFQASQEAIAELKKFQDENTRRQVERARADLIAELRSARSNDDVEGEVKAQREIAKLDRALEEPSAPPPPPAAPAAKAPELDPEFVAWEADNPWFKADVRKHALALGIAQELRAAGNKLTGRAFFDKITEEVESVFSPATRGSPKVAGGRPAGASGGSTRQRTYDDLPSDAKQACDDFGAKLVGPGRAFAKREDWQAHYTQQYFSGAAE